MSDKVEFSLSLSLPHNNVLRSEEISVDGIYVTLRH